jgi:hypothetical protein
MHGGINEFLQCMSEEEAMGVVSNLVRAQAIVGTGAAIREGSISAPGPACLVCALLRSPDTCTHLCGTIGISLALHYRNAVSIMA